MPNETFSAFTEDELSELEAMFGIALLDFYRQFRHALDVAER